MMTRQSISQPLTRRAVLRNTMYAGTAWVCGPLVASLAACKEGVDPTASVSLDVATEVGAFNWCYAIAQLEGDFYRRLTSAPFPGILVSEANTFNAIYNSVGSMPSRFQQLLGGRRITDAVLFRLGELVDFSNRNGVLEHSQTIADTAARSYAWIQSRIQTPAWVEAMDLWTPAAKQRADQIRAMTSLAPLSVTPLAPAAAFDVLEPYYYTTFALKNA